MFYFEFKMFIADLFKVGVFENHRTVREDMVL